MVAPIATPLHSLIHQPILLPPQVLELFGHADAAKQLTGLLVAAPSAAGTPGGASSAAGVSAPSTVGRAQSTGTRSRRSSRRSAGAGGAASMDEDEASQGRTLCVVAMW
jgi:hypothetical protein